MTSTEKYIANTSIATQIGLKAELKAIVSWTVANRTAIASPEEMSSIFSMRPLTITTMSELFTRLVANRYTNLFATVANPSVNVARTIPGIMTLPAIVIDLKQAENANILSGYPELYEKLLVNITHLVKVNRATGVYETSAFHELQSMYVKALLVRSYFESGDGRWLPPVMARFIIKTYALFIATTIARMVNLHYNELNSVAAVFALYMTQLLTGDTEDVHCPQSYLNINYLSDRANLKYIADQCQRYTAQTRGKLNLSNICTILDETGPTRLKDYKLQLFIKHAMRLGSYNDATTTLMALEYPPYWTWMLLMSLSKVKMGDISKLMKQYNFDREGGEFIVGILREGVLLPY